MNDTNKVTKFNKAKQYSSETKERAVRMVQEHRSSYPSQWATIESIASKIGCSSATLVSYIQ